MADLCVLLARRRCVRCPDGRRLVESFCCARLLARRRRDAVYFCCRPTRLSSGNLGKPPGRPQPSGGGAEAVLLLHTTSTRHGNPGKGKKKKDNQLDGHLTLQPPLDSSHGWRGDDSIFPVSASTPSSVINKVCSNCALRPPSLVTAVQSSAHKLL